MTEIVITEFMDESAVGTLRARHATVYDPGLVDRPDALLALMPEARALIVRNRTQVRGALLEAGARLEVVGRLGVGLDNIDVAACAARNLPVIPATGANDLSVAEWAIAAAMMLLRRAFHATDAVIAGQWPRNRLMGRELSGRVIGLIGFGAIAREVARRADALGMTAIAFDPLLPADSPHWRGAQRCDLEALLRAADVVSLHVPLTEATRNMIDAARLALMRKDAVLLNAARGGVVDEAALAAALKAGALAGAALDVFAVEPLTAAAGAVFAGCPNLILTPHIAGVTEESNVRVSTLIAARVLEALGARA